MFYFYNAKLLFLFDMCKYYAHICICINVFIQKPDIVRENSTGQSI